MTGAGAVLKDRHHPGYARAASDADNILALFRSKYGFAKRPKNRDLDFIVPARKQPVTEATTRLTFHHERNLGGAIIEIDHRICAPAGQIAGLQHDELSCLEIHRLSQMQVEMRHVVRQSANVANNSSARCGPVAIGGGNFGRHTKQTIGKRTCLTHENVAFLRFELLTAWCVLPTNLDVPAHNAGTAGPAGSSRTFVRKIEPLAQTCIENRFVLATLKGARPAFALDRYLHCVTRALLEEVVIVSFCVIEFVG